MHKNKLTEDILLTAKEVAKMLGVSESYVYLLKDAGVLKYVDYGKVLGRKKGVIRFRKTDVVEFKKSCVVEE